MVRGARAPQRRRPGDGGGAASPDHRSAGADPAGPAGGHPGRRPPAASSTAAPATPAGPSPDRAAVRQILKWLAASRRGVIVAGGGVLRARASKRLITLADALAVPIIASWRRADVVPNDHPGYLGMTGYWSPAVVRQRLEQADVILVLGARMSEIASYGYRIPASGYALGAGRPGAATGAPRAAGAGPRGDRGRGPVPGRGLVRPAGCRAGRRESDRARGGHDRRPTGVAGCLRGGRRGVVRSRGPSRQGRRHSPAAAAAQRHHHHGRRQLRRLDRAGLPVPAAGHVPGPDVRRHGLRAAGGDRGIPGASATDPSSRCAATAASR